MLSHSLIAIINHYWKNELLQLAANRIKIVKKLELPEKESEKNINILSVSIEPGDDNTVIRIVGNAPLDNAYNYYKSNTLHLMIWNASTKNDSSFIPLANDIVDKVEITNSTEYLEFIFALKESETISEMYKGKNEMNLY